MALIILRKLHPAVVALFGARPWGSSRCRLGSLFAWTNRESLNPSRLWWRRTGFFVILFGLWQAQMFLSSALSRNGGDPHDYRLTASDRSAISSASVVFVNGYQLSPALDRVGRLKPTVKVAEVAVPSSPPRSARLARPSAIGVDGDCGLDSTQRSCSSTVGRGDQRPRVASALGAEAVGPVGFQSIRQDSQGPSRDHHRA